VVKPLVLDLDPTFFEMLVDGYIWGCGAGPPLVSPMGNAAFSLPIFPEASLHTHAFVISSPFFTICVFTIFLFSYDRVPVLFVLRSLRSILFY